jgi:hypothetical protein
VDGLQILELAPFKRLPWLCTVSALAQVAAAFFRPESAPELSYTEWDSGETVTQIEAFQRAWRGSKRRP